jgi:hypothetical protein
MLALRWRAWLVAVAVADRRCMWSGGREAGSWAQRLRGQIISRTEEDLRLSQCFLDPYLPRKMHFQKSLTYPSLHTTVGHCRVESFRLYVSP